MNHILFLIIFNSFDLYQAHLNNKNSVFASKKAQRVFNTKISWFILFGETVDGHSKNHAKPINSLCGEKLKVIDS